MNSWMDVLGQWKHGIAYPRWAALAQYGYGEPRFIFYPPLSWLLGAALGAILPWKAVPGAYLWVALTLSGCSMFRLVRNWLDRRDALFAAALYAVNPYYILIVYWRSAFAELLAGALLPLLLLYVLRLENEGEKVIVPLSALLTAAWLTNIPAAIMVHYSLALLVLVVMFQHWQPRIVLHAGAAVMLGASLAAFFLVPATYEQQWVNIGQIFAAGVRPQDNFLFTIIADADHNRFNLLVSLIASAEIVVLAIAVVLPWRRCWRDFKWRAVCVWAAGAVVLMLPVTFFLWQYLPELRFVQLPWRWLLCLNVALALMVTTAWRRPLWRGLVCLAMLGTVIVAGYRIQRPWWDNAAEIAKMVSNHESGAGYEGTDEYVPAGGDAYDIKRDAALAAGDDTGATQIHILEWSPEVKRFTAQADASCRLTLRLFHYPAWRIELNGQQIEGETEEDTGQMIVPVGAGENDVRITFARTPDRTIGSIVSAATLGILPAILFWPRRRARLGPVL